VFTTAIDYQQAGRLFNEPASSVCKQDSRQTLDGNNARAGWKWKWMREGGVDRNGGDDWRVHAMGFIYSTWAAPFPR